MKPSLLAEALGVSVMTLRRWSGMYAAYLTPQAAPEAGEVRFFQDHDQRIMLLIKTLRDNNIPLDAIAARLEDEKQRDYATLPPVPDEWRDHGSDTISLALAGARASEMASIAALQTQVQHLSARLEEATGRAERLEAELQTVRTEKTATDAHRRALELSLKDAQADARELAARLEAFRLAYSFGRERPVNVGLIIVAAIALVAIALVM